MANSSVKTIINARNTSFKMTGNKTVSASFSSSSLGNDYFYLHIAGSSYQFYQAYVDESSSSGQTKDQAGWPKSNPYVPGAAIQMQILAPSAKTYSVNINLHCLFKYKGSTEDDSDPSYHYFRFRMDVDGSSIYDDGWKTGSSWPYNQNIRHSTTEASLKWIDFGTRNVSLSKGLHTILMRFGACYPYSFLESEIYIDNMRVTLS